MSRFIQLLEPRVFLSATVTKATLLTDQSAIASDAAAVKAAGAAFTAAVSADTKIVLADVKGLSQTTNAPLVKTLRTDEAKTLAAIKKDVNALVASALASSRRSTSDGVALLTKSSTKLQSKVAADAAALGTAGSAPLAALKADSAGTAIDADLNAIVAANSANVTLATDATKEKSDITTDGAALRNAGTKLSTDLSTMASDLASTTSTGGGTTSGNLVGNYSGSSTETTGKHVGRKSRLVVTISSQAADGSLSGTVTASRSGKTTLNATLTGAVTAAGLFSATLSDSSGGGTVTLNGTVSGKTISGTYTISGGAGNGTFTITMV